MKRAYLITGGCGFLGCNIASRLLARGQTLIVLDNLYRHGSMANLSWLKGQGEFRFVPADVRSPLDLEPLIQKWTPDVIFHLAGQVAMTTSLQDPRFDFEVNVGGSINLLEAVRLHSPKSILVFSSSNKVYGDLENISYQETPTRYVAPAYPAGFAENLPLDFHSPYGCSKGAADQYMLDYHRMFGIRTIVFRHSSMYGGRQFSTYDQGWVGWFCQQAWETKLGRLGEPFTISGNGKQVRDLLHADDTVDLYLEAAEKIEKTQGQAFNIGGGMENSLSILELLSFLEEELKVKLNYTRLAPRTSDQKVFVADLRKIKETVGWKPRVDFREGLRRLMDWVKENAPGH
jgi:CDP-paratose 2-epimerase